MRRGRASGVRAASPYYGTLGIRGKVGPATDAVLDRGPRRRSSWAHDSVLLARLAGPQAGGPARRAGRPAEGSEDPSEESEDPFYGQSDHYCAAKSARDGHKFPSSFINNAINLSTASVPGWDRSTDSMDHATTMMEIITMYRRIV